MLAAAGGVALAVWATWPLAAHWRTHIYDPAERYGDLAQGLKPDMYYGLWVLAWDVHALTTHHALWDANVFHPAPAALATSDHMLGLLPLYLPLALATGDPVLAHQGTLLLTFACAFLAMLALVRDWTASWPAAILAGALFAFSAYRRGNIWAIQLLGSYYLPLIPLAARRAVTEPGARWPALLAVVLVLQSFDTLYFGFAAFAGTVALLTVVLTLDPAARRRWRRLVMPVALAAATVMLASVPYLRASRAGTIRAAGPGVTLFNSSSVCDHGTSATAVALAVGSILLWRRGLRGVSGTWLLGLVSFGLCVHAIAVGPIVQIAGHVVPGPYVALARLVPGFSALRQPKRFEVAAGMPLVVLAGIAVAGALQILEASPLRRRPGVRALWTVAPLAAAAWMTGHFVDGPLGLRPVETRDTVPPVYRWLAAAPPGPVLELPFVDFQIYVFEREYEARRMFRSIYHWLPIANGYGGYRLPTYRLIGAMASRPPDEATLSDLRDLAGIRYVVLDEQRVGSIVSASWSRTALRRERLGTHTVYEIQDFPPQGPPPLAHPLDGHTPGGVSLAPLPPVAHRAALSAPMLPPVFGGFAAQASIMVENRSETPWPGVAWPRSGGVALTYHIRDQTGRLLDSAIRIPADADVGPVVTPLALDVYPGQRVQAALWFVPPTAAGLYKLEVYLVQDGVGAFDPQLGGTLEYPLSVARLQ
jgi:hypothetical protein